MRLLVLLAFATAATAADWTVDAAHSAVEFSARHMMITKVKGRFAPMTGKVEYDPKSPAAATIDVVIETKTVNTQNEKRDAHLRSADFFDAEKFPAMTFKSKKVVSKGAGRFEISGDLTLRGVTREVTFQAEGFDREVAAGGGVFKIGGTATARISRKEFGLIWNRAVEGGGVAVSDEIDITLELQLLRKG